MNPELIKLIEQTVRGEIASVGWIVIVVGLSAVGLGAFIGSYLKKMGEYRATKESFKEFLSQLKAQTEVRESLKSDLQENLYYKRRKSYYRDLRRTNCYTQ
jgi:hypothetical protein